ncbi:MAG: NAD(P)-dependent oxidoreductase [Ruminococcaceae bacterium]|nr:NAD(P)-dependent oxidoreductase [Oscillospiraceae bacterium]
MKILVIGGTGHMGTFLCRILAERGHNVTVATRRGIAPDGFEAITLNANSPEELFPLKSREFDTVIDFPGAARNVYDVLGDSVGHIIGCGSLWMYGAPKNVPTPEKKQSDCPFKGYAARFEKIMDMIEDKKCPFTAIMIPNVCGPGKIPLDYMGGRSIDVHKAHKNGAKIYLPDGAEPLISPCDAQDLAMLFALAAENPEKSGNNLFNAGPVNALTITEFVNTYSRIYGSNNEIEYVSWEKYTTEISPSVDYWWHFYSHMCADTSKARSVLGYNPQFTCEETMERAVKWMFDKGLM